MKKVLLFLFVPLSLYAQPGPPSFCFVLAEDLDALRPLERKVSVVQHYRERVPYFGMDASWLKPEVALPLQGGPLFRDGAEQWVVYHPVEGMAGSYLVITAGADTMLVNIPEDPKPLIDRATCRGARDTPEVLRFRHGHHVVGTVVTDPWEVKAASTLAQRLIAEDDAAYKRELAELEDHYRNQPPPAPPIVPYIPPPPMTPAEWAACWAQQPPLKTVHLERVSADTVWVSISGRVMLDGGCASGMPFFSIEMGSDSGWAERLPMGDAQMDCGMPWADWNEHEVMLPPLRWWTSARSPAATKELRSGVYRLGFMGGDMKKLHTSAFELK